MKNERTTEAYRLYYENVIKETHNNPELIARWGKDPSRFETQILCHKSGTKIPDTGKYEEGGEVFGPGRWPYNAKDTPNYSDPPIQYIVGNRLHRIGSTWWDWKAKRTIGLGFDVDSIAGHAPGVGIPDEELEKWDKIDVPWIEVIRSTRGGGRHIYIWFDENDAPETVNHDEHAAIARSLLPVIAKATGLDIEADVDVCGQILWIYDSGVSPDCRGYEQVKPATEVLTASDVPSNWRDHLAVVSGSRTRVQVRGWASDGTETDQDDDLDEMTQSYAKVRLDEAHLKILDDLEATGHTSLWVSDHHLWQGHTGGLQQVFDAWEEKGAPMRGVFQTNSLDQDPGKPNCLAGDTMVITREGVKPIRDLAGKTVWVLTIDEEQSLFEIPVCGKWVETSFKSYGEQEVFEITLSSKGQIKKINATADHRWFGINVYMGLQQLRTSCLARFQPLASVQPPEGPGEFDGLWAVHSVEPAGREEVFCCTVPNTGCFCLEDFILTGNCFMRPKLDGGWDVYRFGEGTTETTLWDHTGKWTRTTYNVPATLRQLCLACDGYEGTEAKHGYLFETIDDLKRALRTLKSKVAVPEKAAGRGLSLRKGAKDNTILSIEKKRGDEKADFPRFIAVPGKWERRIDDAIETPDQEQNEEQLWSELDNLIRALKVKCANGAAFDSWAMRDETGDWIVHPRENIKSVLMNRGHDKPDPILGGAVFQAWTLVNEPFGPEYPGARMWNREGAQFTYTPVTLGPDEVPHHPTWDILLSHCGCDLNDYLPDLAWCSDWGIATGGDYLLAWVACMIQNPFGKLPYLFFYGPQNSGKSSFHESLKLLLTKGYAKADRALTSEQGYNGELENAVLAVVDEVDIAKAGSSVYNKLKEWTMGLTISIHAKYHPVHDVISTLHFCQMANSRRSCPVFPGDTRITAMNVPSLECEIPRDQLQARLKDEAPHFIRSLLDFEIPEATSRLMLPVIETQGKKDAVSDNQDELEMFISDNCHSIPGAAVKFSDFKKTFFDSLEAFQQGEWKERVIRAVLSEKYPVGRSKKHNQVIVGNMSFDPSTTPTSPYVKDGGTISREDEL
jgi:hypothetical protein